MFIFFLSFSCGESGLRGPVDGRGEWHCQSAIQEKLLNHALQGTSPRDPRETYHEPTRAQKKNQRIPSSFHNPLRTLERAPQNPLRSSDAKRRPPEKESIIFSKARHLIHDCLKKCFPGYLSGNSERGWCRRGRSRCRRGSE